MTGWRLIKACKRNSNNFLLLQHPSLKNPSHFTSPSPSIVSDLWGVLCLLQMMIIPSFGTWQSWVRQHMSVVPAFGRLRQELQELKASLGYLLRPCLRKQNTWQCTYTIFPRVQLKGSLETSAMNSEVFLRHQFICCGPENKSGVSQMLAKCSTTELCFRAPPCLKKQFSIQKRMAEVVFAWCSHGPCIEFSL